MKHCPHCDQTLPLADFRTVRKDRPQWLCRGCEDVYRRRRRRVRRGLAPDAKVVLGGRPKAHADANGLRRCVGCDQRLPLEQFDSYMDNGYLSHRVRCHPCHLVERKAADARSRARRRAQTEARGTRGCKRCQRQLPLADFDREPDMFDGTLWYGTRCRECNLKKWKRCTGCRRNVSYESFPVFFDKRTGKQRYRALCQSCWTSTSGGHKAAAQSKPVPTPKPKVVLEKPTYLCTEGCGEEVRSKGQICKTCKIAKFDDTHARDTAKLIRQNTKKVLREYAEGRLKGVLWIAPDEVWAASGECNRCKKPIMPQGIRCYTCATGLPRRVLRLDERAAAAA